MNIKKKFSAFNDVLSSIGNNQGVKSGNVLSIYPPYLHESATLPIGESQTILPPVREDPSIIFLTKETEPTTGSVFFARRKGFEHVRERIFSALSRANRLAICKLSPARSAREIPRKSLVHGRVRPLPASPVEQWRNKRIFSALSRANRLAICKLSPARLAREIPRKSLVHGRVLALPASPDDRRMTEKRDVLCLSAGMKLVRFGLYLVAAWAYNGKKARGGAL